MDTSENDRQFISSCGVIESSRDRQLVIVAYLAIDTLIDVHPQLTSRWLSGTQLAGVEDDAKLTACHLIPQGASAIPIGMTRHSIESKFICLCSREGCTLKMGRLSGSPSLFARGGHGVSARLQSTAFIEVRRSDTAGMALEEGRKPWGAPLWNARA